MPLKSRQLVVGAIDGVVLLEDYPTGLVAFFCRQILIRPKEFRTF